MRFLSRAVTRLRKARRRLWVTYALRGAEGSDSFKRLDLLYTMEDPWNMVSEKERVRFEATNRVIESAFGRVGSVLELGCGEGHQTEFLAKISDTQYGVDVSAQAVERARKRLPQAHFEATDIFGQPWGDEQGRFDLVTACEMLYFLSEPEKTIARMRHLGRNGLITFFAPTCGLMGPQLDAIPGLHKDWIHHEDTVWLIAWWRGDGSREGRSV